MSVPGKFVSLRLDRAVCRNTPHCPQLNAMFVILDYTYLPSMITLVGILNAPSSLGNRTYVPGYD